jgi:hypothetical protein
MYVNLATNLVLFSMQNVTFSPCLVAMHRIHLVLFGMPNVIWSLFGSHA